MTRAAGFAAVAGGVAWLALIPASSAHRGDDLSYDAYYRVVSVPLLLFLLAWLLFRDRWRPRSTRSRLGYWGTLAGLALVFGGNTLEFWGGWLLGKTNARAAYETGTEAWRGSDAGWMLWGLGFFVLVAAATTAAVAAWRDAVLSGWGAAVVGVTGFGVLSANLLTEAPLAATIPIFGAFAAGWIWLGLELLRATAAARVSRRTA